MLVMNEETKKKKRKKWRVIVFVFVLLFLMITMFRNRIMYAIKDTIIPPNYYLPTEEFLLD